MRCTTRIAALVSAVALVALAAVPACAQETIDHFLGLPVTAVRFEVDGKLDVAGALTSLVDVKVGEPLKLVAVRTSIQRLVSVGNFEDDVSVVATDESAGVALLFRVGARHPVDSLQFTQDTGLDPKELAKRVSDQYGGLPTNVPPGKVAQTVRDILNDEGYLAADVTVTVTKRSDPDRATLVFNVAAGSRAVISRAVVNNRAQSVFSTTQLLDRTGIVAGRPYRLGDINRALAAIRDDLTTQRYYAAVASIEPVVSPDLKTVEITLTVDPGPRVEVRWTGDLRPPGSVDELVPIKRERAVDDDLLEDSRVRAADALRADGYVNAEVTLTKDTSSPGVLVVTFDVKRGPRFRVDHVALPDGLHMTTPTLEALIPVKEGDVYSAARIDAALGAVRAEYRRRGFYRVTASADRQMTDRASENGDVWVVVVLAINEGPQGSIAAIHFVRDTTHVSEADLRSRLRSKEREPYVQSFVILDQDAVSSFYLDRGFRTATVGIKPAFGDDGREVTLTVEVTEGPQVTVADIQVIGNEKISAEPIIHAMTLKPGDPYGESARLESQQRINALGLFRRASVDEAPRLPGETAAHVIVTVEEAPARTISFGGGVDAGRLTRTSEDGGQEDYVAVSPRAFFAIQRRNLWGRNSSIDFFSRLALKPTSAPGDPTRDGHGFGFSEYRVFTTYRQPRLFGTDADLLLGATLEQGLRPTFNFLHKAATAEVRRRVTPRFSLSARYALDFSKLFDTRIPPDEQLPIDRFFPQVRLSLVSTSAVLDRRNDPVAPSSGSLLSADFEVAARAIGSQVGYVKTFLQASFFHPLVESRRLVFAGRAELGLAEGFARLVDATDSAGNPVLGPDGRQVMVAVDNLPASQRFFAGGSTTVRGFQLDRLGVPEVLDDAGLSNGGNGLVVLNAEVRAVIGKLFGRNFGVAGFTDGGNVFANARDVDLSRLRGSAGMGLRYDSPLGPVRLDFGFKFSRMTFSGGTRERGWEFHFNIGEAF